jgi:hypothetical protein
MHSIEFNNSNQTMELVSTETDSKTLLGCGIDLCGMISNPFNNTLLNLSLEYNNIWYNYNLPVNQNMTSDGTDIYNYYAILSFN